MASVYSIYHLGIFTDFTEAVAHRLSSEQCLNWSNCDSFSPAFKHIQNYLGQSNMTDPIDDINFRMDSPPKGKAKRLKFKMMVSVYFLMDLIKFLRKKLL